MDRKHTNATRQLRLGPKCTPESNQCLLGAPDQRVGSLILARLSRSGTNKNLSDGFDSLLS